MHTFFADVSRSVPGIMNFHYVEPCSNGFKTKYYINDSASFVHDIPNVGECSENSLFDKNVDEDKIYI